MSAGVYVKLADGTVINGNTASYSMKTLLEAVNTGFDALNDTQKAAVQTMCAAYATAMESWSIDIIRTWAPATTEPETEPTT